MSNTTALKRALFRSVVAAGGVAVTTLIVTAPTAWATDAKDVCKQMHGQFDSSKDGKGNRVESCSVDSGGGPVVGSWVNGQWQGAVAPGEDVSHPGAGHTYVPINSHPQ